MKIIISPAKKMISCNDDFLPESTPVFLEKTQVLLNELKSLSKSELKEILQCNDQLLSLNYERYQTMDLSKNLSCALMSYVGLQYQHMGSSLFSLEEIDYLQKHLRILSGFYGLLRPLDGIVPYRLEMQAKLPFTTLYAYWNSLLSDQLTTQETIILNLASKEYSQAVKPYLPETIQWIDVDFLCEHKGKLTTKATEAKMCRGSMVRFCAEHHITHPDQLCQFTEYGYQYSPEHSCKNKLVFVKRQI